MMRSIFLPSYSIGSESYSKIGEICKPYGKKIVVIGGKTALEKAEKKIKESLKNMEFEILETLWYGGEASFENVERLEKEKSVKEADMIFAVGGGKALDACKLLSEQLNKPIFTFPTIASTCAAITTICVMYTKEGAFKKLCWRKRPAEHTFIDTEIISNAPTKYFWAGIGDTIAKGYEPEFSARGRDVDYYNLVGLRISSICATSLIKVGEKALKDCENNIVSPELEESILGIIINTGLVSNHLINDYNSCVAHAICYGFSMILEVEHNHLHGEIVSYGVLVELMLDKNLEEIDKLISFCKKIKLPISYKDFGVTMKEMEEIVLKRATQVNDMKAVPYEITLDMLKEAVENLEEYVNKIK